MKGTGIEVLCLRCRHRGTVTHEVLRCFGLRPCALKNDEVTLQMATLGSAVDSLGPFVDGDAILGGILRSSRSAWPAAFVTTREITPQLLGPLGCPIDEGIDRLATHGPQTTFVSSL